MNLMERMRNYVINFFGGPKEPEKRAEVGLVDVYLEKVLQIVFWESYERTLKAFFILNTLFWLMLMSNLRLYGVLSLLALIFFLYNHLFRDSLFWEYRGEYSAVVKDLRNACLSIVDSVCCLRKDSPVVFYSSMSLVFLMLHMVSKGIPGEIMVYLSLMGFFIVPHYVLKFKHLLPSHAGPECILAEDELIPFIKHKDLNKRDADLESLLTDRTTDSVTNSLASGITSMPSYLEVAEIPNEIQEDDLIPHATKPGADPSSSDSDDSENREIKFDSDHFNTSSSEEDPYTKDLAFPKSTSLTPRDGGGAAAATGLFRSMINTVGGNVVANMFQSAVFSAAVAPPARVTVVSDSDSSDFEIVDANEISDDIEKDE